MDELPSNARALLELAARGDAPTPAQRAHSEAQLRAVLQQHGVHGLPPLAAVGRAGALRRVHWLRWGAGAGALVVGGVLGLHMMSEPTEPAPARPRRELPQLTVEPAQIAPAPQPIPNERGPVETSTPQVHHAPPRRSPAKSARDDSALAGELRALASVNALVHERRFDEALRLLASTRPRRGPSPLQDERDALRVVTLCGRAQDATALEARDRFLRDNPGALLAERVRSACDASLRRP